MPQPDHRSHRPLSQSAAALAGLLACDWLAVATGGKHVYNQCRGNHGAGYLDTYRAQADGRLPTHGHQTLHTSHRGSGEALDFFLFHRAFLLIFILTESYSMNLHYTISAPHYKTMMFFKIKCQATPPIHGLP